MRTTIEFFIGVHQTLMMAPPSNLLRRHVVALFTLVSVFSEIPWIVEGRFELVYDGTFMFGGAWSFDSFLFSVEEDSGYATGNAVVSECSRQCEANSSCVAIVVFQQTPTDEVVCFGLRATLSPVSCPPSWPLCMSYSNVDIDGLDPTLTTSTQTSVTTTLPPTPLPPPSTARPSPSPSQFPTDLPSLSPTPTPSSFSPTSDPTNAPTTRSPTSDPTMSPTVLPTESPSIASSTSTVTSTTTQTRQTDTTSTTRAMCNGVTQPLQCVQLLASAMGDCTAVVFGQQISEVCPVLCQACTSTSTTVPPPSCSGILDDSNCVVLAASCGTMIGSMNVSVICPGTCGECPSPGPDGSFFSYPLVYRGFAGTSETDVFPTATNASLQLFSLAAASRTDSTITQVCRDACNAHTSCEGLYMWQATSTSVLRCVGLSSIGSRSAIPATCTQFLCLSYSKVYIGPPTMGTPITTPATLPTVVSSACPDGQVDPPECQGQASLCNGTFSVAIRSLCPATCGACVLATAAPTASPTRTPTAGPTDAPTTPAPSVGGVIIIDVSTTTDPPVPSASSTVVNPTTTLPPASIPTTPSPVGTSPTTAAPVDAGPTSATSSPITPTGTVASTLPSASTPMVVPTTDAPSSPPAVPTAAPTTPAPSQTPTLSPSTYAPTRVPTTAAPTTEPTHQPTTATPTHDPASFCNGVIDHFVCPALATTCVTDADVRILCPATCGTCVAPTGAPTPAPTQLPTPRPSRMPTTPAPTSRAPTTATPSVAPPTTRAPTQSCNGIPDAPICYFFTAGCSEAIAVYCPGFCGTCVTPTPTTAAPVHAPTPTTNAPSATPTPPRTMTTVTTTTTPDRACTGCAFGSGPCVFADSGFCVDAVAGACPSGSVACAGLATDVSTFCAGALASGGVFFSAAASCTSAPFFYNTRGSFKAYMAPQDDVVTQVWCLATSSLSSPQAGALALAVGSVCPTGAIAVYLPRTAIAGVTVQACVVSTGGVTTGFALGTGTCGGTVVHFVSICEAGTALNPQGTSCVNVNECTVGTAACDEYATCTDTTGSFLCACNVGWTGSGTVCADVHECTDAASNNCAAHATCAEIPGSYVCTCNDGWMGSGQVCTDVDECNATHTCDVHATCANSPGSFSCACSSGWSGNGQVCVDVDECALGSDNCHATRATCANTDGSFTCTCRVGFTGSGVQCGDIDECSTGHECHVMAECQDENGYYTCACNPGWTGNGFQCADVDECTLGIDNCGANTACTNAIGSFACTCSVGYTAASRTTCVDVDECASGVDQCAARADCTNSAGSYACACGEGWTGDGTTCTNVNECAAAGASTCSTHAVCSDIDGSFTCACNSGWTGDGISCVDIAECSSVCDVHATCDEIPGSFTCSCTVGYIGNGTACRDFDECILAAPCDVHASCSNTDGSFACACNTGYVDGTAGSCDNIDECLDGIDTCASVGAVCADTDGSFQCACTSGYTGDGVSCENVDECIVLGANDCDADAVCSDNTGSFTCACNTGYTGNGTTCNDINECTTPSLSTCDVNARCTNTGGSFSCACTDGYVGSGLFCNNINECAFGFDNCDILARCTDTDGSHTCTCNAGYTGDGVTCRDLDECSEGIATCGMHASCTNTVGSFVCNCDPGWLGPGSINGRTCLNEYECTSNPCDTRATCADTPGSYTCACRLGWTGDGIVCTDIDECNERTHNCPTQQSCVNLQGTFTCLCPTGFAWSVLVEPNACVDTDECLSLPCDSDATCTNTQGSYSCACNSGYVGSGFVCARTTTTGTSTTTQTTETTRTTVSDTTQTTTFRNCTATEFQCFGQGACLPRSYRCNGFIDCDNGSDEYLCPTSTSSTTTSSSTTTTITHTTTTSTITTLSPTAVPTANPSTREPTGAPTTATPTQTPTTRAPTTGAPVTFAPVTYSPVPFDQIGQPTTVGPTSVAPTSSAPSTLRPTATPTTAPSDTPTGVPTNAPTDAPTVTPSDAPTTTPTQAPSATPTQFVAETTAAPVTTPVSSAGTSSPVTPNTTVVVVVGGSTTAAVLGVATTTAGGLCVGQCGNTTFQTLSEGGRCFCHASCIPVGDCCDGYTAVCPTVDLADSTGAGRQESSFDYTILIASIGGVLATIVLIVIGRRCLPDKESTSSSAAGVRGGSDRSHHVTFNSAYDLEGGPRSQSPDILGVAPEVHKKLVMYGPADRHIGPLDDHLVGQWVHDEMLARKQDVYTRLAADSPEEGDFAVLKNPPGHEVWGILVVVLPSGKIKKTEVVRAPDASAYILTSSTFTHNADVTVPGQHFGDVLLRLSSDEYSDRVAVPLFRGIDVLSARRLTTKDVLEEIPTIGAFQVTDELSPQQAQTLERRNARMALARLVHQKCWIDTSVAETMLGARGQGAFVVWQRAHYHGHLVLSVRAGGGSPDFDVQHLDVRVREGGAVVIHLGASAHGTDEQLQCRSIEELIVALSAPDKPMQLSVRLREGLLKLSMVDDLVEEMQFLEWREVAQDLEFRLIEPDTGSLVLTHGHASVGADQYGEWSEDA